VLDPRIHRLAGHEEVRGEIDPGPLSGHGVAIDTAARVQVHEVVTDWYVGVDFTGRDIYAKA
jgi:hypothetical protein